MGLSSPRMAKERLPVGKAVRYLFEKLITTEGFLNVFLETGRAFNLDTGCHPEYATPECASPLDLVIYDKVASAFSRISVLCEQRLREEA